MSDSSERPATVYEIINLKVFTALIEALCPDGERITLVCNNVDCCVNMRGLGSMCAFCNFIKVENKVTDSTLGFEKNKQKFTPLLIR